MSVPAYEHIRLEIKDGVASFLGTGWSFPPEFVLETGEVRMSSDERDIEESLRILFGTAIGERFLVPRYGLDMRALLFDPISTTMRTFVKERITTALLIHEPRIVLLDEPSSGLDAAGRAWLADRLAQARRQGQTVCLATHDHAEPLWECDRVLVLRDGRLSETAVAATCQYDAPSGDANRFAA